MEIAEGKKQYFLKKDRDFYPKNSIFSKHLVSAYCMSYSVCKHLTTDTTSLIIKADFKDVGGLQVANPHSESRVWGSFTRYLCP